MILMAAAHKVTVCLEINCQRQADHQINNTHWTGVNGRKGSKELALINQPTAGRQQQSTDLRDSFLQGREAGEGTRRVVRSFQRSRLGTSSAGDHPPEIRFSKSGCSCPTFI